MIRYNISSNIKEVASWAKQLPLKYSSKAVGDSVARIFMERARARLKHSGALQSDIDKFVNAITFRQIGDRRWVITAGSNTNDQLREDMYYLEYGTGIIGMRSPHPNASKIGWKYAINRDRYNANARWTFRIRPENGNVGTFIAKSDIVHLYKRKQNKGSIIGFPRAKRIRRNFHDVGSDKSIESAGVKAIRYFYDTMLEFDDILEEALKENGVLL